MGRPGFRRFVFPFFDRGPRTVSERGTDSTCGRRAGSKRPLPLERQTPARLKSALRAADNGRMGGLRRTAPPAAGGRDDLSPALGRRDDLSPALIDERGHARSGARDRELGTESALSVLFLAAAVAMALFLPRTQALDPALAAWLVALCCATLLIEFDVSAGRTRPVQLVLLPMLLLLPPALVPLLVAAAHVLIRVPPMLAGRMPAQRAILVLADPWFCVPPALLLAVVGLPQAPALQALVLLAALASQFAADLVASALRLRIGLGVDVRPELTSFGWIYLVDALLTPVGLLAAAVGSEQPLAVAAVLPLAALLAVFARERRGRIDTALELHRVTEQSEARLQSIVQHSSDLIAILDRDWTIRTLTGSVEPVFGANWRDAIGTSVHDRVHPEDSGLLAAFLAGVARGPVGESQEAEWRIKHPSGSWRHVETVATNLLDDPRLGGIVLTARDVNDRKAFEEQLRHRAFHDPLTQLANRALFYDRIEHTLTRDGRAAQTVAVLFIDLDDFKLVNDERGHAVGDELLAAVAQRLRGCLRSADTAARLGGDEFGVLLEAVQGPNEPVQVAERILAAFGEPLIVRGVPLAVPVSIGITVSAGGDRSVDELLRRADLAMYAAKRGGKRRWELYDAALEQRMAMGPGEDGQRTTWFQRSGEQREEIVGLLQRENAVTTVFQPILDLRTGLCVGYEALSRFVAPEQRPPNAWFAQAHRVGLGYELEARAIASALATPGRPEGTYLTVNMSPSSLTSSEVQAVLPESLDGLVIELTENELLGDDPAITAALADVRARGGRVAVDDAGAGYAGLKHVMRLAPDLIKLDRALVTGVHADPVRAALIESFVRYAREIDATVCAEGIETLDDLERLADLDVTYGQGYAIARPATPWAPVSRAATEACTVSLSATLAEAVPAQGVSEPQDRRLERVTGMLSRARGAEELEAALGPIARDLHADLVVLLQDAGDGELDFERVPLMQVLAGDASADPAERAALEALGYRSLLRMPVCCEDRVVGALEAYSREERPWSRFEIRRARMISHQLGAAVERVGRRAGASV
jgi:diguanylate cyclase (GGDEF)-like protein/PAS domain S-box-containing protein